jgi:hypothetical protein
LPSPGAAKSSNAVASDGKERQQEQTPGCAARGERLLHAALELALQKARALQHPEDHPGEEGRRQKERRAVVDLLRRALELRVQRVEQPEESEAHRRRDGDAAPHEPVVPSRADLRQIREDDAHDERHLHALTERDDERRDVCGGHLTSGAILARGAVALGGL